MTKKKQEVIGLKKENYEAKYYGKNCKCNASYQNKGAKNNYHIIKAEYEIFMSAIELISKRGCRLLEFSDESFGYEEIIIIGGIPYLHSYEEYDQYGEYMEEVIYDKVVGPLTLQEINMLIFSTNKKSDCGEIKNKGSECLNYIRRQWQIVSRLWKKGVSTIKNDISDYDAINRFDVDLYAVVDNENDEIKIEFYDLNEGTTHGNYTLSYIVSLYDFIECIDGGMEFFHKNIKNNYKYHPESEQFENEECLQCDGYKLSYYNESIMWKR